MKGLKVVGQSVVRVDALEKVTGKARFPMDFKLPATLCAKILRSPYAHARIISIDTSKAEQLPGVRAVVTGVDAPNRRLGPRTFDQYLLGRDKLVRCVGQAVAAVAAETVEIAEDALELIDVAYEELPAVFDVEEAAKKNPPTVIHPDLAQYFSPDNLFKQRINPQEMPNVCYHFKVRKGDVAQAFANADCIVENRYSTARVSHASLETYQCDAWIDPDGTLVIRSSIQGIPSASQSLADFFGLPRHKVRMLASYIGGGFGGKVAPHLVEPIAALLTMKAGRPVRLVYSREEHFVDGRHRIGFVTHIKDGVNKDGTLVAREMRVYLDLGRHVDASYPVPKNSSLGTVSTYRIANLKLDHYGVYTNNPVTGPFRGLGVPEVLWAVEQQMDLLARKIGMDPAEFRRRNILQEGDKDGCGQPVVSFGMGQCLDKVTEWVEQHKPTESQYPWKIGRGVAIGSKYTMAVTSAAATVKVHPDGTIEVRHGNQDIGQGLNTVVAQIAAEEFATTVDKIKVVWGDTAFVPFDYYALSSRSVYYTGNAVKRACQDARRKVFDIAATRLGVSPASLEVRDGVVCAIGWPGKSVPFSDLFTREGIALIGGEILGGDYSIGAYVEEDVDTGQSEKMVAYYAHGAYAVEVAVNVETGQVKVLKAAGAFDPGTVINPKMAQAQIDGGFVQGVSIALGEQIIMEKGVVVNPTFMDYKMLSAAELPANKDIKMMLVEAPLSEGPFGAKGLGEGTLVPLAPAIGNAIYDAIGVRVYDIPVTREKVLAAIKQAKMPAAVR